MCVEGLSPARALHAGAVSSEGRCSDSAFLTRFAQIPKAKVQIPKFFRAGAGLIFWNLAIWIFGVCTLRVLSPLAFTGCPIGFAPALRGMGVCDALPQRNCGRISRPSLLLQS